MAGSPFDRILNCDSLPTLPTVALELLEKTRDPDVSIDEIARLVQADQGLSAKILRTVNSSFFGLTQPCPSIDRAIGYLGLKAIKSLVLGFSMVSVTRTISEDDGFDLSDYWRRTTCAAAAARQVALLTNACDADEAFTAALFQDMGMLAAFVALGDEYDAVLKEAAGDRHCRLPDVERERLGFTHPEVGAALAEQWKMPESVIVGLRFHHDPDAGEPHQRDLLRVVATGRLMAETMIGVNPPQALAELCMKVSEWFGRPSEEIESLLESVTTATRELAKLLEQNIGGLPAPSEILARANEQLSQQQAMAAQETMQLEARTRTLEKQTLTDGLTGAANRKQFDAQSARAFEDAVKSSRPLAVLFIDADHFKAVNDTHGHQAGDAVLIELAQRLTGAASSPAVVCRYGGEEFAIVVPDADESAALMIAERCRQAIAAAPFDVADACDVPTLDITVSIGVSTLKYGDTPCVQSAAQLVKQADEAVYAAKSAGRNCVRVFGRSPAMGGDADSSSARAQPRSPRVFIVEDDALASSLMRFIFDRLGYEVKVFRTGSDLLDYLATIEPKGSAHPTLIVSENELPDFNGTALIRSIRLTKAFAAVPIAIAAARFDNTIEGTCLTAGASFVHDKSHIARDIKLWVEQITAPPAAKEAAA